MSRHRTAITLFSIVFVATALLTLGFKIVRHNQANNNTVPLQPAQGTVITRSNAIDVQFVPGVSLIAVKALAGEYGASINFLKPPYSATSVTEAVFEFSPGSTTDIDTVIGQLSKLAIVQNATSASYRVEYDQPL